MRCLKNAGDQTNFFFTWPNFSIIRTNTDSLPHFTCSVKRCNFTSDFSKSPIFRTNFRFPWRFEKSEFHFTRIVLLKSVKTTSNRFALQFCGEFNWKDCQICLLCSLCVVVFIAFVFAKIFST